MWVGAREVYRRTRKRSAAGVDGVTAAQYETALEANLTSLLERFQSGRSRAPAVRRVHIPKAGVGKQTRPIGIPTLEDTVLQRAGVMALEPMYEQDFLDCSYGFRPGRGAHQALERLWRGLMDIGGGWVVDLDIQHFFDSVDRAQPRAGAGPAGARRRDTPCDWEVGTSRCHGRRLGLVSGPGYPPRWGGSARCARTSSSTKSWIPGFTSVSARACGGTPSWCAMPTMRCWAANTRTTRGGSWRCSRSVSGNTA